MLRKVFNIFNSKQFLIFSIIVFTYILSAQSDNYFKWIHPKKLPPEHSLTILTDGGGYYAYLPKWYIYTEDKDFHFLEDITLKYNTSSFIYGVRYDYEKHKGTNKYYAGTAICSTPVFLINHALNKIIYGEGDGYSRSYQLTVSINAILFWLIGIIGLIKLFKLWKIENFWIVSLVAIVTFGTNLNFYTVYFPSFSHVFSFAAISWFVYTGFKWGTSKSTIHFFQLCALVGLIFSIRPTNSLVVLMIPFFFSDWSSFVLTVKEYFTKRIIILPIGFLFFFVFVFIQLFNIYNQIGSWSLNTYSDEHFDFLYNPQIFNILFSYKKGFFIYSPVMLLIFVGLIRLYKFNKYLFIGWFITCFSFIYLTAAWWCWWYGGGLGLRPFIDILPILILPLAIFFQSSSKFVLSMMWILSILFIYVYQIFQIQYNKNIIHYDLMDKENYWRIFMKTDMRYSWCAAFKDEKLPQKRLVSSKEYNYSPISNSFHNKEEILENQTLLDPSFTFIPNENWTDNLIGISLTGAVTLTQQESNPSIDVFYYNNGKEIKKATALLGYRVPNLNESTKFHVEFNPRLYYKNIDSIHVNIGRGVQPTWYESIQLKFYNFSRK
ncbi:MAG: hypothetical protein LW701_07360 [Fluviicola sp.]|nr:hypothetical protein [Fluviicola sp.]